MKCVKCGVGEALFSGICSECMWEALEINKPSVINKTTCPKCGSIKVGNYWSHREPEIAWFKTVAKEFSANTPFAVKEINNFGLNKLEDEASMDISIDLRLGNDEISERVFQVNVPYTRDSISCPTCNKITGSYYEAKVQIRGFSERINPELENIANELVKRVETNQTKDPNSFISKVVNVKEGVDVYLGKKKDGDTFSREIVQRDVCQLIVSSSLAGIRDGKQFFRFTYMLRILDFEKGSIIYVNKEKYIYVGKTSSGIFVISPGVNEPKLMRKATISLDRIRNTGEMAIEEKFIVINRQGDEMTLLNERDFKQVTVKGKVYKDYKNESIRLLKYDDFYYFSDVVS